MATTARSDLILPDILAEEVVKGVAMLGHRRATANCGEPSLPRIGRVYSVLDGGAGVND